MGFLEGIIDSIYKTLVADGRWQWYVEGFVNSIIITVFAAVLGVLIGILVAMVKVLYVSRERTHKPRGFLRKLLRGVFGVGNWLCNVYTTVIRGTPVVLQLLIFYYFILVFVPTQYKVIVAVVTFGINSGAYVSEIIRAGIQSIDKGQTEAGRSLGLTKGKTMRLIVLPQAVRNILPALFNEMITLLKETSVAGYISITDITRAGDLIRSRTFEFTPLFVSAIIYLILVFGLTQVQKRLEKRMAKSDQS